MSVKTILIILGKQSSDFARGNYNQGLFETAVATLKDHYRVLTTVVEDGYEPDQEREKFKQADVVIYQFPVFWFHVPALLKAYVDQVYSHGVFFGPAQDGYGSGGLMTGKQVMLSTTWNAPHEAFGNSESFFEGMTPEQVLLPMRRTHGFCGFSELPHFSAHDVIHQPDMDRDRARLVAHLEEVFALTANPTGGV